VSLDTALFSRTNQKVVEVLPINSLIICPSHLSFTFCFEKDTGADGRPDAGRWTGLMLWLQKVVGEPWTWSIRPEELGLFLEESGWTNVPALVGMTRKHGVEFFAVGTK